MGELVIELPHALRDTLWDKSQKLGGSSDWGFAFEKYNLFNDKNKTLIPQYRTTLEPYTYAVYITDCWMKLLNSIAEIVQEYQPNAEINSKYVLPEDHLEYVRRVCLMG